MELTVRWCETCGAETSLERPAGDEAPELACVECGSASFEAFVASLAPALAA